MTEKKDRDSLHQIQEPATAQAAQRWCETMDRPAASCGCPDCGSSLIDLPAKAAPPAASVVLPEPVAYSLGLAKYAHSSNIIAANEFTPDAEHADEWENLYTEQQVRALLATATGLPAQAVPDGWKLVPGHPTKMMVQAARKIDARMAGKRERLCTDEVWAIIAAALSSVPQPPAAAPQAQADARDAESDYQRGYRHGYNRRDAEVQGALL